MSKKQFSSILFILFLFSWGWQPTTAQSAALAQNNTIQMTATAGFDGFYKSQFWVPLQIAIANSGSSTTGLLQVNVDDSFSNTNTLYETTVSLPNQSNKLIQTYLFLPNLYSRLTVTFLDEKSSRAQEVFTNNLEQIEQNDLLYGIISSQPDEFTFLETVSGGRLGASVAFMELDQLPALPTAWHALDILVLSDVDSAKLTSEQQAALQSWLQMGGQLVITGGANWQKTTTAFSDLLPVSISGTESVADLPAFSQAIGVPFRDNGPYILTTSSLTNGELLYHQNGIPILARKSYGRGHLYFLALDPQFAPLKDWDGNETLWSTIANMVPELPFWALGIQNPYSAQTAVGALPEAKIASTLQLVCFLLFYIIAIGPANYLILKRRQKLEWAWLTTPAIILFFSGLTYIVGFQTRGNKPIINQLSIAYGIAGSDTLRTQTVVGLYSPNRKEYSLTFDGQTMVRTLPNNSGSFSNNTQTILRDSQVTVSDIFINTGGTETLLTDSYLPAPPILAQAELEFSETAIVLSVEIQNKSDITLENSSLLMGMTAIPLKTLPPGETTTIQQTLDILSYSDPSNYGSSQTPLSANYSTLLGSSDYAYSQNAQLYAQYQLLESFTGPYGGTPLTPANETITLVAWSDDTPLNVELGNISAKEMGFTLYFLEVPYTESIPNSQQLVVSPSLWNWELLNSNASNQLSPINLNLYQGWAEFEFEPWAIFQRMELSGLDILVQKPDYDTALPQIWLWDWVEEEWQEISNLGWGETDIEDFAAYVGVDNQVRIRLQNLAAGSSSEVKAIYPILTGMLP